MPEAVQGTIYIAKCTRNLFCRFKSEKLHTGSQYGITEVDYVPAGCTNCQHIIAVNVRDTRTSDHCPTCKGKLQFYIKTGREVPTGPYLCPKCQHETLIFELAGFVR